MLVTRNDAHEYFADGDTSTPYPSVTTVIGDVVAKSGLLAYTRREAIEYLLEFGDAPHYLTGTQKQRADRLEASVTEYSMRKARDGNDAHGLIEQHIKTVLGQAADLARITPQMPMDAPLRRFYDKFLSFERLHKVRWVASELPLISRKWKIGGTLDALGYVTSLKDGIERLCLIDFKTGRRTWLEHALQLSAYLEMLRESDDLLFIKDQRSPQIAGILHIPDGEDPFEWKPLAITPEDFRTGFLPCLDVYRWLKSRAELVAR